MRVPGDHQIGLHGNGAREYRVVVGIPLNEAARDAITRMLKRADELRHTDYLWCASQHHHYDPTGPAKQWDGAWRSLRDAAGLPRFRFHDLRHRSSRTCSRPVSPST